MRTASTTARWASSCRRRPVERDRYEGLDGVLAAAPFAGGEILTTSQVTPAASEMIATMKTMTPSSPKNVLTTLVE